MGTPHEPNWLTWFVVLMSMEYNKDVAFYSGDRW